MGQGVSVNRSLLLQNKTARGKQFGFLGEYLRPFRKTWMNAARDSRDVSQVRFPQATPDG